MGKKSQPAPAPQIIQQPKNKVTQQRVLAPEMPDYAKQQQDAIDAANRRNRQIVAANQKKKETALKGQATDIIDSRLSDSASKSNLYGTRFKMPDQKDYQALVSKEFSKLIKMDSGQRVDDESAAIKKKKYEGFKRGRGRNFEPLSESTLLGN